jgi:hypothetical protein
MERVLPISVNLFMARGERIELSQSDLESNSPILGTLPRLKMEPSVGFEPTTYGLQNRCTTTVLTRHLLFIYINNVAQDLQAF